MNIHNASGPPIRECLIKTNCESHQRGMFTNENHFLLLRVSPKKRFKNRNDVKKSVSKPQPNASKTNYINGVENKVVRSVERRWARQMVPAVILSANTPPAMWQSSSIEFTSSENRAYQWFIAKEIWDSSGGLRTNAVQGWEVEQLAAEITRI